MEVENIAGVSFASGRTAEEKRQLAVRPGVFGQIVIDDEGMSAVVAEVFTHSASGVRRNELDGSGFFRGGGDDGGMFHGAVVFQNFHHFGNG